MEPLAPSMPPSAGAAPSREEVQALTLGLAHDLRSPINAVAGFGRALERLLARDDAPPGAAHYVQRILAAAEHLEEYVDALMSLARVSQAPRPRGTVDLSAMALQIARELRLRDPSRVVDVRVQPGLAATGDAGLLRMLLENLLGNAWKFTARRVPAIVAFDAQRGADGETVYCVRDNGAGFEMAYSAKLFRDFQRLHSHAEFPGTGVGLANVRRIVERHGGRVWADGIVDGGAAFSFTLAAPTELAAGNEHVQRERPTAAALPS
jgi:light-regulated signal transduction histidine kinase (bacteriophytochrome)